MGFLSRLFARSKPEQVAADAGAGRQGPPEDTTNDDAGAPAPATGATGTVLRRPSRDGALPGERPGPGLTALEIAEQAAWEVKSLRPWEPGEVILARSVRGRGGQGHRVAPDLGPGALRCAQDHDRGRPTMDVRPEAIEGPETGKALPVLEATTWVVGRSSAFGAFPGPRAPKDAPALPRFVL
ncbi:MAG: hypothetical protein HYV63_12475 [Candidatus Schekmanbacteria bacterium]|nr:hypothetical protein [Candidatus Schekmanbacteria bacterium]